MSLTKSMLNRLSKWNEKLGIFGAIMEDKSMEMKDKFCLYKKKENSLTP